MFRSSGRSLKDAVNCPLITVKHFIVINLTDICFKLQSMTFSTKCACDDVCAPNN